MDMINGFLIHSTSLSSFLMKEISFIYDTMFFFSSNHFMILRLKFSFNFPHFKIFGLFCQVGIKWKKWLFFLILRLNWNDALMGFFFLKYLRHRFLISRISFFLFSLITTTQNIQTENLQFNCYFDLFLSDAAIRACWNNWSMRIHAGSQIVYL